MTTREEGFTLLEILVALTILGVAITVMIQLFSANLRSISASRSHTLAVAAAEARMRDVLADRDLAEKQWREQTEDGYTISVSVSDILNERTERLPLKLLEIELALQWMNGAKLKTITLKTLKLVGKPALGDQSKS